MKIEENIKLHRKNGLFPTNSWQFMNVAFCENIEHNAFFFKVQEFANNMEVTYEKENRVIDKAINTHV